MALPLGIQLFSVRDFMEKDPESTLRELGKMGYDGVELCGLYDMPAADFKKICDESGLRVISGHGGDGYCIDEIEKTVEDCRVLGAEYIVLAYNADESYPGGENFITHSEKLRAANEYANKFGIQILCHNHEREMGPWNGGIIFDELIAGTGGTVMYEPDMCWVKLGGHNPVEFLANHAGRCPLVHIKDYYCDFGFVPNPDAPGRPADMQFRPVGYGRQDMPAIIDAAERYGSKWLIVEQDQTAPGKTQLECASLSCSWIKTER